jgi:hypothetical protein
MPRRPYGPTRPGWRPWRTAETSDRHGQTPPSPSIGPPLLSASWSPPFPWGIPLGAVTGGVVVGGAVGGGAAVVGGLVAAGGGGLVVGGGGALVVGGAVVGGGLVVGGGGGLVVGGAVGGGAAVVGGLEVVGGVATIALTTGVPARVIAYQVPPKPVMPSPLASPGLLSPAKV